MQNYKEAFVTLRVLLPQTLGQPSAEGAFDTASMEAKKIAMAASKEQVAAEVVAVEVR